MLVSSTVSYVRYQDTEQHFRSQLTYEGFMGDITESLRVTGAVEAAGKVEVNALLCRVDLLLIWLSQHISSQFNLQKALEALCLFPLLKRKEYVTSGGYCHPHTFSASASLSNVVLFAPDADTSHLNSSRPTEPWPKVYIKLNNKVWITLKVVKPLQFR